MNIIQNIKKLQLEKECAKKNVLGDKTGEIFIITLHYCLRAYRF